MHKIDTREFEHEIRCKINLGIELNQKEESHYILYMASHDERLNYIKRKKEKRNAFERKNSKERLY